MLIGNISRCRKRMTEHFNPVSAVFLCLISGRVLGFPALRDPKDGAITLPGGQMVQQCYRIETQGAPHMFLCDDQEKRPLLLTISSVEKLGESTSPRKAQYGNYFSYSALGHRIPSFLQQCRRRGSENRVEMFQCTTDRRFLHVGVRNHVVDDYRWVEVMVDGADPQNGEVWRRGAKDTRASTEKEPSADRTDCVDENDPACDLEQVRDDDN